MTLTNRPIGRGPGGQPLAVPFPAGCRRCRSNDRRSLPIHQGMSVSSKSTGRLVNQTARTVASGVAAAAVAAVVCAVAARLFMRLVAIAAGLDQEFTLGGSLFIVVFFTIFMLPVAVVAAFTTRRWRLLLAATIGAFVLVNGIRMGLAELDKSDDVGVAAVLASLGAVASVVALPVLAVRLADRFMGRQEAAAPKLG